MTPRETVVEVIQEMEQQRQKILSEQETMRVMIARNNTLLREIDEMLVEARNTLKEIDT